MKIYRMKAYSRAREGELPEAIYRMGIVRNYAVGMMRTFYKMTGKTLTAFALQGHIAKKKKNPLSRTAKMVEGLPSQSVQECIARIYKGYRLFFSACKKKKSGIKLPTKVRPPRWRKAGHNKSFTLLQAGYSFNDDKTRLRIGAKWYGFHKSQEIKGKIKRITIKRDRCGDVWFIILTDWSDAPSLPMTGKSAGFDFGLKTFLTRDDGFRIEAPQFIKRNKRLLAKAHKSLSRKAKGSNHRRAARLALSRLYRKTERQREDWQWKMANSIVKEFDIICIEDLNLDGMKRLWGRKVSDYAFGAFVAKLEYLAAKNGKEVRKVDKWYASSQTCHECGHRSEQTKDLSVREWVCPHCGAKLDRDINAARNILMAGTSAIGRGSVRPCPERGVA